MNKKLIVRIAPDGEVTIDAKGYTGQSCEQATKPYEAPLGAPSSKQRKPEYYQAERADQSAQQEAR